MGFSLNRVVKPQSDALNKGATVLSGIGSPTKRKYAEGQRPDFSKADLRALAKNLKHIAPLPFSLLKTVRLIQSGKGHGERSITGAAFAELDRLIGDSGIDAYGYFELTPGRLFLGHGAPYRYALVLSMAMDRESFAGAPSIACQIEVARVYAKTGQAANAVAEFLQKKRIRGGSQSFHGRPARLLASGGVGGYRGHRPA